MISSDSLPHDTERAAPLTESDRATLYLACFGILIVALGLLLSLFERPRAPSRTEAQPSAAPLAQEHTSERTPPPRPTEAPAPAPPMSPTTATTIPSRPLVRRPFPAASRRSAAPSIRPVADYVEPWQDQPINEERAR